MYKFRVCSFFIFVATALQMYPAGQLHNSHAPSSEKKTELSKKGPSGRPNAPSRVTIPCIYGDGFIELQFPEGIHSMMIVLDNDILSWSGIVYDDNPVADIPSFEGDVRIECTADNGHIFYGILSF